MRRFLLSATAMLLVLLLQWPRAANAITAPELRGSKSMQDLSSDMHGRNLQQKEFLKMDLEGTDFSQSDLRGSVFNTTQLQDSNFSGADLRDVVAFSSRFDRADLTQARLDNGMLLQSKFTDAQIDGADFSNAVLDQPQIKQLCARATGVNEQSGLSTADSLGCG